MSPTHQLPRMAAASLAALALLVPLTLLSAPAAPAAAADGHSFTLSSTIPAGRIARSIAFDKAADALRVPIDNGAGGDGSSALSRIDAATFTVAAATVPVTGEPSIVTLDPVKPLAYIAHYRSGILSVVDTSTGTLVKTISGIPEYPSAMEYDAPSDTLFIGDDTIVPVTVGTGTVGAEIAITTQKYPLLKDIVLDTSTRTLWVTEGRAGVVTAVDIATLSWKKDVAVPVTAFTLPGTASAGRPNQLAIDEKHHSLYVTIDPKFNESWTSSKLVTIDTKTLKVIGSTIDLGTATRELVVDPVSSELYATNGNDNSFVVVSPQTWTISDTIDFSAAGITEGTGTANSNVWGIAVDANRRTVYVSHPYARTSVSVDGSSAVSKIDRAGTDPTFSSRPVAPGQGVEPTPEPVPNKPFTGPASAPAGTAPAGAVVTAGNTLRWSISAYAQLWKAIPYGTAHVEEGNVLSYDGGTGWTQPGTGETQISWPDAVEYRQYPGLAPDVFTTFANPFLTVRGDGSGTLTFDVAWGESDTNISDGFRRVTVATFAAGTVSVVDGAVTLVATPEFKGRSYVKPDAAGTTVYPDSYPKDFVDYITDSMRGWWLTTGASAGGNALKVPTPFTAQFVRTAAAAGPTVETPTEPTTPTVPTTPVAPTPTDSTVAASPVSDPSGGSESALASTGTDSTPFVPLAAGLLLAGLLGLAWKARLRARR